MLVYPRAMFDVIGLALVVVVVVMQKLMKGPVRVASGGV